jgi:hypothetical protein
VGDVWSAPDEAASHVVWMVVEGGLAVWCPALDPYAEAAGAGVPDVALDLAFTPAGPSRVDGAVVSLDSRVGPVGAQVTCTTSPLLHGLLAWLLKTRRDGLARRVLAARAQTRLVQSALEDLLQAVLLESDPNQGKRAAVAAAARPTLIAAAVPALASIVAHCARQIDPGLWDVLFSVVGAPLDLFDQCLATYDSRGPGSQGLLRTASELLPILDDALGDEALAPASRARQVLDRCAANSELYDEVIDYCRKRKLDAGVPAEASASFLGRVIDLFG